MGKLFVDAEQFLLDSFRLGKNIYDSGFRPDFLVGVWRGGTTPAIAIQEFFEFKNVKMNHHPIKTDSYTGVDERNKEVKVTGSGFLEDNLNLESSLLIIDDIFDTGLTIRAILTELKKSLGENYPNNIKIATIYYKPTKNKTNLIPNFYIHETDTWVVFPHEVRDLTEEELKIHKKEIYDILESEVI